jgi:hypothetical protein
MSKYDDKAVIKKLKDAFVVGASIEIACGYAGICERIFYEWQAKAEAGNKVYAQVMQDIKGSMATGDMKCLDRIDKAVGEGVWQAAAWKLERRHPDTYGSNAALRETNNKLDKVEQLILKQGAANEKETNEEQAKR